MRFALAFLMTLLIASPGLAQDTPAPSGSSLTAEQKLKLDELKKMPLAFTAKLPPGAPDPASWEGFTSPPLAALVLNAKTEKEKGTSGAVLAIQEGLCPDSNAPCFFAIKYEFSRLIDPQKKVGYLVVRYLLVSDKGKRLEGYALEYATQESDQYSYWVVRKGVWVQRKPGTAEYKLDDRFLSSFMALMVRLEDGPQPKPQPKPGTTTAS